MSEQDGRGKNIDVDFDAKRCIHARQCVMGLPKVFRGGVDGNWIFPDSASADDVAALVSRCPSGALSFTRKDGGSPETQPPHNIIAVAQDGPLHVRADATVDGERRGHRLVLCRCGHSKNKPYCDNSHRSETFAASGEPTSQDEVGDYPQHAPLAITARKNGPLHVKGAVEIVSASGRPICKTGEHWLCRCGHSKNKPFCDGSHNKAGFKADGAR